MNSLQLFPLLSSRLGLIDLLNLMKKLFEGSDNWGKIEGKNYKLYVT